MMTMTSDTLRAHPGAVFRTWLLAHGYMQVDAAETMGYSQKHISCFINGRVRLTPTFAVALAKFTGVPVLTWLEYEALYIEQRIGRQR
jgi:plasmid maintenance system antidote protein VapI